MNIFFLIFQIIRKTVLQSIIKLFYMLEKEYVHHF